jgi:hypothetical protein
LNPFSQALLAAIGKYRSDNTVRTDAWLKGIIGVRAD